MAVGGCSAFAGNGAPYVFTIGKLVILPMAPYPGGTFANAVATCASYIPAGAGLSGQNCTFALVPYFLAPEPRGGRTDPDHRPSISPTPLPAMPNFKPTKQHPSPLVGYAAERGVRLPADNCPAQGSHPIRDK